MSTEPKTRTVAIVGRPNVGKSAVFNRLVGRRVAIVHAQSGVTRDRLVREATWNESRFLLVDTGGIAPAGRLSGRDPIEAGIYRQVDAAVADAAAVLFVTDLAAGRTPLDDCVAGWLRDSGRPVVVAANKADSPARDSEAADFAAYGWPVFPVSALHDRGFAALMAPILAALPEGGNPTLTDPLRVAVVGRPNVGKSSYINRLLRDDRVLVSDVPGTTRDRVDVPFTVGMGAQARHYLLMDTAGMRRRGKIDSAVEQFGRMRAEGGVRDADVVALILDAEQGPTRQDKQVAALVLEERKGCLLLVNKWDRASATQRAYGKALLDALPFLTHCPVVCISAKTGYNIRRSVDAIDHVAAQTELRLPTGVLNRTLLDAVQTVQPPMVRGRRLKLFYATQTGVRPVRLALFVNTPGLLPPAYEAYLVRVLRERFGLEGAPVTLDLRPRRESRRP
jgi:GTPase